MKTREELLELDRDELLDEIRNASGIEIGDEFGGVDLTIGTWSTADGYEVYVVTNDERNINWESDVYYYKPDCDDIMDRLADLMDGDKVYCDDTEEYFDDEEAMIDYLLDNFPEKYIEYEEEDNEPTGGFSGLFK